MTDKLKDAVNEFLDILDIEEESDSGRVFHPVYISCCRCLLTPRLNTVLKKMKELSQKD